MAVAVPEGSQGDEIADPGLGRCHSALLLAAGAMPGAARAMMNRFDAASAWLPGRRSFAVLLAAAGLWWIAQRLAPEWAATLSLT